MKTPSLLLLHGALGSASQFMALSTTLEDYFDVHSFDFSGHGANDYDGILTMDRLSADILHYIERNGLERTHIFGYSMGGYAAITMALQHPERIHRIMTLGTKWHWDTETATNEVKMLDADIMTEKIPAFTQVLRLRHTGQGWRSLLRRTAELMTHLGQTGGFREQDLRHLDIPVRICLGTEDRMVTRSESMTAAECMKQGNFRLLEGVPHPLEKVDLAVLTNEIRSFFMERKVSGSLSENR